MRSGFAHFDDAHRENFCASVLLFAMDTDEILAQVVARFVLSALSIALPADLLSFGREARLVRSPDHNVDARADLWLLFGQTDELFVVLVEVKTHGGWDPNHVGEQVLDQASRAALARIPHPIRGSVLLAPDRLGRLVRSRSNVKVISWADLLRDLRRQQFLARSTQHALQHLEEHVERPIGNPDRSLDDFERVASTVACLRAFLNACVEDIGGEPTGFNNTHGDGEPRLHGPWAWHGFSVSFKIDGSKYRLGIYSYVETPAGDTETEKHPWLEAYLGDMQEPLVELSFDLPSLGPEELENVRSAFHGSWNAALPTNASP